VIELFLPQKGRKGKGQVASVLVLVEKMKGNIVGSIFNLLIRNKKEGREGRDSFLIPLRAGKRRKKRRPSLSREGNKRRKGA